MHTAFFKMLSVIVIRVNRSRLCFKSTVNHSRKQLKTQYSVHTVTFMQQKETKSSFTSGIVMYFINPVTSSEYSCK